MTVLASGTQTAVIGNEHVLYDTTSVVGVLVPFARLNNMQAGDVLELRSYTKVLGSSALEVVYEQQFNDAQAASTGGYVQIGDPVPSDQEYKFTLKQTAGTGRDFDWKVVAI
jgi:hypothetical protein